MNRLARLIETLSLHDLELIRKDLEAGNVHRLVERRIHELDEPKTCPTCGEQLTKSQRKYAIEFGPEALRQKAYFDELDCLDYFLKRLHSEAQRQSAHRDAASHAHNHNHEGRA